MQNLSLKYSHHVAKHVQVNFVDNCGADSGVEKLHETIEEYSILCVCVCVRACACVRVRVFFISFSFLVFAFFFEKGR